MPRVRRGGLLYVDGVYAAMTSKKLSFIEKLGCVVAGLLVLTGGIATVHEKLSKPKPAKIDIAALNAGLPYTENGIRMERIYIASDDVLVVESTVLNWYVQDGEPIDWVLRASAQADIHAKQLHIICTEPEFASAPRALRTRVVYYSADRRDKLTADATKLDCP